MAELIVEIAIYLGLTALLGLLIGYIIWGMGRRHALEALRAENAAALRDAAAREADLKIDADEATRERDLLKNQVEKLNARLAAAAASQTPALERGRRQALDAIADEQVRGSIVKAPEEPAERIRTAPPAPEQPKPNDG